MRPEKQTAQEVELPGGEETEENLPLVPTPSDGCEAIVVIEPGNIPQFLDGLRDRVKRGGE